MPRFPTFPILYDDTQQISISKLKEWGFLLPGQIKGGTLTWSINEEPTGSISIMVDTYSDQPCIELDYKYQDIPRNYIVNLVSLPSNLGKGRVWYFVCPKTNKRCRILYSINGYFYHREAFTGCFYFSQTRSKKWRIMESDDICGFRSEKVYRTIYSKHFKKHYNGNPTKRYRNLLKMIGENPSTIES